MFQPIHSAQDAGDHLVDNYFRCNIFWIYIINWDHVWYKFFFGILNVSGFIGYPFRFGSDNTYNPKYDKTRSIRYLCWICSDSFLSDRIRFRFSGSEFTSPNLKSTKAKIDKIELYYILKRVTRDQQWQNSSVLSNNNDGDHMQIGFV